MKEYKTQIVDPVGLHARPATVAVNAASKFRSDVTIGFNGKTVNMKSIMGVMSLGVPTLSNIVITCDGEDEEDAIKTIVEALKAQKIIG